MYLIISNLIIFYYYYIASKSLSTVLLIENKTLFIDEKYSISYLEQKVLYLYIISIFIYSHVYITSIDVTIYLSLQGYYSPVTCIILAGNADIYKKELKRYVA